MKNLFGHVKGRDIFLHVQGVEVGMPAADPGSEFGHQEIEILFCQWLCGLSPELSEIFIDLLF